VYEVKNIPSIDERERERERGRESALIIFFVTALHMLELYVKEPFLLSKASSGSPQLIHVPIIGLVYHFPLGWFQPPSSVTGKLQSDPTIVMALCCLPNPGWEGWAHFIPACISTTM
jgi:hypothetical protein